MQDRPMSFKGHRGPCRNARRTIGARVVFEMKEMSVLRHDAPDDDTRADDPRRPAAPV
ncbi:hypothetical protein BRPE64_ACDS06660 [Caballeronia insecticola]|uniref:Uncharacterized protein n=1 Tax=Caballeronia insecticola TaxID=758793 RepID=R4WNG9_9BURK|nr:hypothetical protein BRPE64_ACDS06660 [Caballeronia insecticola]